MSGRLRAERGRERYFANSAKRCWEDGIEFFDATAIGKLADSPYGILFFHGGVSRLAGSSRISVAVHEIPLNGIGRAAVNLETGYRALMKENRSKTGNYLRFGPKVFRK